MSFQYVAELLRFVCNSALLCFRKPSKRCPVVKRIPWGSTITDCPDMVLMGTVGGGKKVYRREGDRMRIGGADIEAVLYGFYKDRLEEVQLRFRSFTNFTELRQTLFRVYGRGRRLHSPQEAYHWNGRRVSLVFTYDELSGRGVLGCTYIPIYRERQQMRRNLEEYKQMVARFKMVKKEVLQSLGGWRQQEKASTERRAMA